MARDRSSLWPRVTGRAESVAFLIAVALGFAAAAAILAVTAALVGRAISRFLRWLVT